MRKLLILGLLVGVAGLIAGCDDDECVSCPDTSQQAMVVGMATTNSGDVSFSSFLFATDGGAPIKLDSVTVAGERGAVNYFSELRYYGASYGGSLGLASGDTLVVKFFSSSGNSIGRIKLLDVNSDRPVNFNHPQSNPYDAVALGDQITVTWDEVSTADWYEIFTAYAFDSSGTGVQRQDFSVVTEPLFTIPGTKTQYEGQYYISVMAGSGPNPEGTSVNVSGGVIEGMITSRVSNSLYITVGTGIILAPPLIYQPDEDEVLIRMMEKMR